MPVMIETSRWFKGLFVQAGISNSFSSFLNRLALIVIVVQLSRLSNLIAKDPEKYRLTLQIFDNVKPNRFCFFKEQSLKYLNNFIQY